MAKKAQLKPQVRVLNDRVLVRRADADASTPGGIVLPENSKEQPTRGEVVAVGTGRMMPSGVRSTMDLKEGDFVIFARHGGSDIEVHGETLRILSEADILAVLR